MSKAELYIGTDLLDFNDEINVVHQLMDWRDPEIGSNHKSYPIEIPLTRGNRRILQFPDHLGSRQQVSAYARLVLNGMEVIHGKFRILSANREKVEAIIDADDWLTEIEGVSIKDLSWAGGDQHYFNASNIMDSWTAAAGAFYRYPLINWSRLYSEEYGAGAKVLPYDFYPMWNLATIIEKIFTDAGFTIAANGFTASAYALARYLLSVPTPVDDSYISGKDLYVVVDDINDNYQQIAHAPGSDTMNINQIMVFGTEQTDEGNDWATNQYTVPEDGTYRFRAFCRVNSDHHLSEDFTVTASSFTFALRKNGYTVSSYTKSGTSIFNDYNETHYVDAGWQYFEQGDVVDFHINISSTATNITAGTLYPELYLFAGSTTSYGELVWDQRCLWPGIGQMVGPAELLPDIDCLEFLQAVKKLYNLRFWLDFKNQTIYIETADDFNGSTVVDWSGNVDYGREIELEDIAVNYKKYQHFLYKADENDRAYTNYKRVYGEPLDEIYTMSNEYCEQGTDEIGNDLFAATIMGTMHQVGEFTDQLPRIWGSEESSIGYEYPDFRPQSWLPRILAWNGMISFNNGDFDWYYDMNDQAGDNYTTFPSASPDDWADLYDDFWFKTVRYMDNNKLVSLVLTIPPHELNKFITVVGDPTTEGFRAVYKVDVEGEAMYFMVSKLITDGDRIKVEMIQKM